MDTLGIIFTVVLIIAAILAGMYFLGRYLQKKQNESQTLIDQNRQKIVLFYETDEYDDITLTEALKNRLQRYMLPNVLNKLDKLPLLRSGKVDRVRLKEMI